MISARDDSWDARVAELQAFLDEIDRRDYSNFKVTNPTSGVANLEVTPETDGTRISLRDDNGNTIFGNNPPEIGFVGFRMPMPMYPSIPTSFGVTATTSTFVTTWQTTTRVTSTSLAISYRFGDLAPAGGTTECRVRYDIGGGPVVVADSVTSGVNPVNSIRNFELIWPSDVFETEVSVEFQARMASGTGSAVCSPMWVVGGHS